MVNPIQKLHDTGQSLWYDNIQRRLLVSGELEEMITRGDIRGVTSNPAIFNKAITNSDDYDAALSSLAHSELSTEQIFYRLAVEDIRAAADLFIPLYQESNRGDGYVSLEVDPYLADDSEATVTEAKRLWEMIGRPNLMIKIPATKGGIPAIAQAIAAGININVTLIFSRKRYAEVMNAYMRGLEQRIQYGLPIDTIASVASFFVSRVDTKVDARLQEISKKSDRRNEQLVTLYGKAAIANARLAYKQFLDTFNTQRFRELKKQNARLQRPLWASTSTKNPAYRDVLYVEELIGPDTVNTVPPHTLEAFRDHGEVRLSLQEDIEKAQHVLKSLEALGISVDQVTHELEEEGVKAFADAYTTLLKAIERQYTSVLTRA
ncbi:MAG: transaldolase [Anaerolineales bacterium]|jgi:transaldolase